MATKEQVLGVLAAASGPMSREELGKKIGENYRHLQTRLNRWMKDGLIEDTGDHHYTLTEKGKGEAWEEKNSDLLRFLEETRHEQSILKLQVLVPDFAKCVAPLYRTLGWKWGHDEDNVEYVPSEADIARKLYRLIKSLTAEYDSNRSGGLEAYIEGGACGLRFIFDTRQFDTLGLRPRGGLKTRILNLIRRR